MSRAEGFAAVPNWMIRDRQVPRNAILVYASLSSRAGMGAIFPSQATIAEESGLSERTVRTMLKSLEEIGVVERRVRRGVEGKSTSRTDAYTLHPNGRDEGPATVAGRSKGPANGGQGSGNQAQVAPLIEVDREEVDRDTSNGFAVLPTTSNDVVRLCDLLAEAVRANGHKVGVVGQTWHAACDRLIRLDGYTPHQVEWIIRWATSDEFWAANIRSMPTLREKFSTLVAQAKRKASRSQAPAERAASVIELGRRLQAEDEAAGRAS